MLSILAVGELYEGLGSTGELVADEDRLCCLFGVLSLSRLDRFLFIFKEISPGNSFLAPSLASAPLLSSFIVEVRSRSTRDVTRSAGRGSKGRKSQESVSRQAENNSLLSYRWMVEYVCESTGGSVNKAGELKGRHLRYR